MMDIPSEGVAQYTAMPSSKTSADNYKLHFLEEDSSDGRTNINGYQGLNLLEQTTASIWDIAINKVSISN